MKLLKSSILILTVAFIIVLGMFYNSSGQVSNLTDRHELTQITNDALDHFGIDQVTVYIYPASYLPQYRVNSLETGISDVEETGNNRPDIYRIFVDLHRSDKQIIMTLLHELTHLAQHYSGRLDRSGKYTVYNGDEYTIDRPYRLYPWEIEARRTARKLLKDFF